MQAIKGKNTRPELLLRRELRTAGVTGYRVHNRDVPGTPDIAVSRVRLAIFVDGVFWHGHPTKFKKIKSNYWRKRIQRNMLRDRRVQRELTALGWEVIRIWDLDIMSDGRAMAQKIVARVHSRSACISSGL